jgi:hypothetical protein
MQDASLHTAVKLADYETMVEGLDDTLAWLADHCGFLPASWPTSVAVNYNAGVKHKYTTRSSNIDLFDEIVRALQLSWLSMRLRLRRLMTHWPGWLAVQPGSRRHWQMLAAVQQQQPTLGRCRMGCCLHYWTGRASARCAARVSKFWLCCCLLSYHGVGRVWCLTVES